MTTENHPAQGRLDDGAAHKATATMTKPEVEAKISMKPIGEFAANSRFIPIDLKRFVFARSKGRCEFVDPPTKTRCESTFRLQIDHQIPLALGGETKASNLRHLCSAHNLRMATQAGLHKPRSKVKYC